MCKPCPLVSLPTKYQIPRRYYLYQVYIYSLLHLDSSRPQQIGWGCTLYNLVPFQPIITFHKVTHRKGISGSYRIPYIAVFAYPKILEGFAHCAISNFRCNGNFLRVIKIVPHIIFNIFLYLICINDNKNVLYESHHDLIASSKRAQIGKECNQWKKLEPFQ